MPERFGSNESTFDALRGQTLNLPVNGSAAGAGAADSTYLRLDATNDPVTGALDVKVDSADALRVLTSGSAEVFVADTLANLIMGRLNEVWVQETKYLVVDAGGLGDYTTIQAALDYIMALAGPQTYTIMIRDGTYAEILTITGSVSANRTVSLVGLGKETILAPGLSAAQHVINSGTYTTINCINIKIQPTGSSTGAIAGLGSGVGIYFWDCRIEPLGGQKLEAGGSGSAYFARCEIGLAGRTYSDMVSSSGIGSAVYCYYCRIYGGASNGTGLVTGANLTNGTFLYHCEVFNGGGAASYDLRNAGGAVTVGRCLYNRTKTSGTITVLDGDIPALTTSDLPALTSGNIFVGNVSNVATSVTMSNDATIVASGALTLKNTGPGVVTVGDATHVAQTTLDAQGRVTGLTSVAITFPAGVTGSGTAGRIIKWDTGAPSTALTDSNLIGAGAGTLTLSAANTHTATFPATGNDTISMLGVANVFSANNTWDTNTLFVDAANHRVGVGTIAPTEKLTISGSILINVDNSYFGMDTVSPPRMGFVKRSGNPMGVAVSSDTPFDFLQSNGADINPATRTFLNRMRINNDGKVGIQQTIPTHQLHVMAENQTNAAGIKNLLALEQAKFGSAGLVGDGGRISFLGRSSTTAGQSMSTIETTWTNATHASLTSKIVFQNRTNAGALTDRFAADGPAITLSGSQHSTYTTTAIDLALDATHHFITVTAVGKTITLPAAATCTGREYIIKAVANNVVIDANASETIDGSLTATLINGECYQIKSDGANWHVI